jgi:hypothetical protein
MENHRRVGLISREELKGNTSNEYQTMSCPESAYSLIEHVKDYDHGRKCRKGYKEFDVADIYQTREGEVFQRGDRRQVSCHREGDEGELYASQNQRHL